MSTDLAEICRPIELDMADFPWVTIFRNDDGGLELEESTEALLHLSLDDNRLPDFVTLIGGSSKSRLFRELTSPQSPVSCMNAHNQIRLWNEPRSQHTDNPKIYIDCEMHRERSFSAQQRVSGLCNSKFYPLKHWKIGWAKEMPHDKIAHRFYEHVVAPLSSIICYFAGDLGGIRGVARLLADQLLSGTHSRLHPQALPRVLVVVETTSCAFDASLAEARLFDYLSAALEDSRRNPEDFRPALLTHFYDIRVLGLHKQGSVVLRSTVMRRRIASVLASARSSRRSSQSLLSAAHSKAFFSQLIENFCLNREQFDFIRSSRAVGLSLQDFPIHFRNLLDCIPSETWLWHTVAPLVASALFYASYPPNSHYFDPKVVFNRLYLRPCEMAMVEHGAHRNVQADLITAIQERFMALYRGLVAEEGNTTVGLHLDTLRTLQVSLEELKSNKSCLCCLLRTPEKVLTCGHALCDVCIQSLGHRSISEKYTFSVRSCPLCGAAENRGIFNYIPPTAGIRILSLDGGGVRGVVELAILQHIYFQFSHLRVPFSDFFDYVCGTSAGGLIVLGLFLMQWTPEQCLEKFENLAAQTFKQPPCPPNAFSRLRQALLSYIKDGKYESTMIEEAFHSLTKKRTQMFNPLKSETKVAVTTTTARDVVTCLFANYNGQSRPSNIGYQIVRAKRPQDDVHIHEAASCTSAAPWFFKPKVLENLGTFQDGGLQHNNPLGIALCEYRFIWPEKEPDFALSIGTGTSFNDVHAVFEPRSPVQDRTLHRLFRSFMRHTDGEKAWIDFINSQPKNIRHRYHRLNLNLEGIEPEIDDVHSMARLRRQAEGYIKSSPSLKPLREAMFASCFYFELDGIPNYEQGSYHCTGAIFCRLNLCREARKAFYEDLFSSAYYFLVDGRPVRCAERIPKGCPLFRKRIEFRALQMDHIVAITMGSTETSRYISGLPKTLDALVANQKLCAPFGRTDHQHPGKGLPSLPLKRKRGNPENGGFF